MRAAQVAIRLAAVGASSRHAHAREGLRRRRPSYGKEEPGPYRTITPDSVQLPREGEHDGLEPGNRS
jgi:hypothetical protein